MSCGDVTQLLPNDALQEMREAGFNAVRVLTKPEQSLGPSDFRLDNDSDDLIHRERNYLLDWGGIDQQAKPSSPSPILMAQLNAPYLPDRLDSSSSIHSTPCPLTNLNSMPKSIASRTQAVQGHGHGA